MDEAHAVKNRHAARTKRLRQCARRPLLNPYNDSSAECVYGACSCACTCDLYLRMGFVKREKSKVCVRNIISQCFNI